MKNRIFITITMLGCLSLSQVVAQNTDISPMMKKGKWGYVNSKGEKIIDFKYKKVSSFNREGFAEVQTTDGKYGYIDKTGKEIIPCKYDKIDFFHGDLAIIYLGNKIGYIDKTGKEIIPCKYDEVSDYFWSNGLAEVQFDGKWGCIDKTGREIIPCKYDKINNWRPKGSSATDTTRFYEVFVDGKYGKIDRYGRETEPLKYENQMMQEIWEKLLIPHGEQIKDYMWNSFEFNKVDKFRTKSSSPFTIKRPYLLVSASGMSRELLPQISTK